MTLNTQAASAGEAGAADTPSPQHSGLVGLQFPLLEHAGCCVGNLYVSMQT